MRYAYDFVPYYRALFKSRNLEPSDIRFSADTKKIPILTRADLISNFSEMRSSKEQLGAYTDSTGGSTGQPVRIVKDKRLNIYAMASQIRSQNAIGWEIGDKVAYIWGAERDSPRAKLTSRVGMIVDRIIWLNSFRMTDARMEQFASLLCEFKPKIIIGYATSLHLMARYLLRNDISPPRILGIQSSAESLFEVQRRDIEGAFRCKVFDKYGSREFGTIAHECSAHLGPHINSDIEYLEFQKDGETAAKEEEAKILVTSLVNFSMPLIRYDIGDFSSWKDADCPCGRGLPLMSFVKGRTSDIITTPNGNLVHGEYFTHLFYKQAGVKEFQVEQISPSDLVVRVVVDPSKFSRDSFLEMEREIHRFIDESLQVQFEIVESIPLTRTGKHRFTLSQITPPI